MECSKHNRSSYLNSWIGWLPVTIKTACCSAPTTSMVDLCCKNEKNYFVKFKCAICENWPPVEFIFYKQKVAYHQSTCTLSVTVETVGSVCLMSSIAAAVASTAPRVLCQTRNNTCILLDIPELFFWSWPTLLNQWWCKTLIILSFCPVSKGIGIPLYPVVCFALQCPKLFWNQGCYDLNHLIWSV